MTSTRPLGDAARLGLVTGYLWYGGREVTGTLLAQNIETLLYSFDQLDLGTAFVAHLEQLQQDGRQAGAKRLPPELAQRVRASMVQVNEYVSRSLHAKPAVIAREGMFSSHKLLNDILSLLPQSKIQNLPLIAAFDLEQAGRCIVLDLPTSAAFHLMRAVESCLRLLYRLRKGAEPPSQPMGSLITALRKGGKEDAVLSLLDIIREHFRNPTAHPNDDIPDEYDSLEAEHLLALATFAISKILDES